MDNNIKSRRDFITKLGEITAAGLILLYAPGLTVDNGLFAQESNRNRLEVGDSAIVSGKVNAEEYLLTSVISVATDSKGNIFINDGNKAIKKFSPDGKFIYKIPQQGESLFVKLKIDQDDNLYASTYTYGGKSSEILRFNTNGKYVDSFKTSVSMVYDFSPVSSGRVIVHGFQWDDKIIPSTSNNPIMPRGFMWNTIDNRIFHEIHAEKGLIRSFGMCTPISTDVAPEPELSHLNYMMMLGPINIEKFNQGVMCLDSDDNVYFADADPSFRSS